MKQLLILIATIATLHQLQAAEKIGQMAPETVDKELAAATLVAKQQQAPDFTCRTTDGRNFTLSALKGKVVVLYFFSASVGACVTEMQNLEAEIFHSLRNREDFQLIAIGRDHSREELVQLGGKNKLTFPLVPDPDKKLYGLYFSKFVPRTVVVRKDGSIAYLANGYHEFEGIPRLQAVLAQELAVKTP